MKSLYFLGDYIDLKPDDVIELYPGYRLRRPSVNEVKNVLKLTGSWINAEWISHFEKRFEQKIYDKSGILFQTFTEEINWTYSVIEHDVQEFDFLLELTLRLSNLELRPLVDILSGSTPHHYPMNVYVFFAESDIKEYLNPKNVTVNDIKEINYIMATLKNFEKMDGEFPYISKAIEDFYNLITIPKTSPFKIFAIFAIIESLLTNNSKDSGSSINRQLQKKIILLNNRFKEKIDFVSSFKGTDKTNEETIIKLLYSYRSDIAHGDISDFNNQLQILVSAENVHSFLNLLVKKIILQAITEPQLITDLKEC